MNKTLFVIRLLFASSLPACAQPLVDALKIKIATGNYSDEMVIRFTAGATNGFDGSYDAWELFPADISVPSVFTRDSAGDPLAINALPAFNASVKVNLFFAIGAAGTYSVTPFEIGAFAPDVKIVMRDARDGSLYNLRDSVTRLIELPVLSANDSSLFQILFSYPMAIQPVAPTCAGCTDGGVTILKAGQTNWQYNLVNAAGAPVASGTASSSALTVNGLAAGNYTVTVSSDFSCVETASFSIQSPVTFYAAVNGNWETPSTWSTRSCGGKAAASTPGPNDNIVICHGKKVILNRAAGCHHLSIEGTLECHADLTVSGNWTNSGSFCAGNQTIVLNGSRPQLIGGSKVTSFNNLFIDNSAPSEAIRLSVSANVNGVLTLKDGHIITTSSEILSCGPAASVSLAGFPQDSSFVKGPMLHTVATAWPVAKIFPVGKGNSYRSLDVFIDQKTAVRTSYVAEMFDDSPAAFSFALPEGIDAVSDVRYHQVTQFPATHLDSARVEIHYGCAGLNDRVASLSGLRVVGDNGSGSWENLGNDADGQLCDSLFYSGSALSPPLASFKGTLFCLARRERPARAGQAPDEAHVRPIAHASAFSIYPNPASGYFMLHLSECTAAGFLTIRDISGKICYAEPVPASTGDVKIEITDLQPGVYLVTLSNNRQIQEKKLLIK